MLEDRAIRVATPAVDELIFTHLTGSDEVSRCFTFTIGFTSLALDVDAGALLHKPMAIEAESSDPKRWFHGIVTEFRLVKIQDRLANYEARLEPWLALLGNTYDCRVFQKLSVVEIVEEIFKKYPEAKFEKRLQQTYDPREYCVQYDESDLNFVQRLLEHEGIFCFFEYFEGDHTLVLTDAMSKLQAAEGYATVPFHFEDSVTRRDRDCLSDWVPSSSVQPAKYAHTDYNFEKPSLSLMALSEADPVPGGFSAALAEGATGGANLVRRPRGFAPRVRTLVRAQS